MSSDVRMITWSMIGATALSALLLLLTPRAFALSWIFAGAGAGIVAWFYVSLSGSHKCLEGQPGHIGSMYSVLVALVVGLSQEHWIGGLWAVVLMRWGGRLAHRYARMVHEDDLTGILEPRTSQLTWPVDEGRKLLDRAKEYLEGWPADTPIRAGVLGDARWSIPFTTKRKRRTGHFWHSRFTKLYPAETEYVDLISDGGTAAQVASSLRLVHR